MRAVVILAHVVGNVVAAGYLLPEADSSPSFGRITAAPTRSARAILMSPVLEEVIFRGLMSCVIYNRCRDPKPLVANAMFAAIHLNNMLGTDTPREEVYLQCAMAFVLGWYYAVRLQRGGSLWETIGLHAINNSLAMVYDASLVEDRSVRFREPALPCVRLLALSQASRAAACLHKKREI